MVACGTPEEVDRLHTELANKGTELNISGIELTLMDHGFGEDFTFNDAFSFMVLCDNQEEIKRITEAFFKMKKFDIAALVKAEVYENTLRLRELICLEYPL